MTTAELEREYNEATTEAIVEWMLAAGDEAGEDALSAADVRCLRVARELARRDYSERSHGSECTCVECMFLLETWVHFRRRRPR